MSYLVAGAAGGGGGGGGDGSGGAGASDTPTVRRLPELRPRAYANPRSPPPHNSSPKTKKSSRWWGNRVGANAIITAPPSATTTRHRLTRIAPLSTERSYHRPRVFAKYTYAKYFECAAFGGVHRRSETDFLGPAIGHAAVVAARAPALDAQHEHRKSDSRRNAGGEGQNFHHVSLRPIA